MSINQQKKTEDPNPFNHGNKRNWDSLSALTDNSSISLYSFDFWNTIVFSNPIFKQKRAEYLISMLSQDFSLKEINQAFEKVGQEYNRLMEAGSKIVAPEKLYLQLLKELKYSQTIDLNSLLKGVEAIFLKYPPSIDQEFLDYFDSISKEDIKFSITSNTAFISGSIIRKFLKNINLLDKFNFCLFSDEVGYGKPNKKIYECLYSKSKECHSSISKIEIIHIGDNYEADYMGAVNFGIKAFHIKSNQLFNFPRYAVHSINDINNIPFSSEEYSRFKFGDYNISKKYGAELFDYFKSNHLTNFSEIPKSIIIYSSPYSQLHTSSYYMAEVFFELFEEYIILMNYNTTKLKLGKINRSQSYTEDYGAMDAMQRYNLIKNDTYSFFDVPEEKSFCIFIDDISITGTHQVVIENMMKKSEFTNKSIFLYFAKLDNPQIKASFENDLNFAHVNSIDKLFEVISSDSFKNTTRTTKFILNMNIVDFNYLMKLILKHKKNEIFIYIYQGALLNNYDLIEKYQNNLKELGSLIIINQ